MTPRGSDAILQARMAGNRPADPVVVSFAGDTGWANPHVFAEPGVEYDWRFLVGLPVYIVVKPGIECREAIRAIYAQAELYPTLVDIEAQTAASVIDDKPLRLWPIYRAGSRWKDIFQ